jgi:3'-phosphoadenosine 5'-phosphosulfate sulfotransferase (PAPS reductase)/FAD synthetase
MIDEVEFYLKDLASKFRKLKNTGYKYYLSYSGGKDSHFLYWFMRVWLKDNDYELYIWCLENIVIVACNTYMEHQEIRERMYKYADIVLKPKMKPMEIKSKYGIPCFSKQQDFFIYYFQRGSKSPSVLKRFYGEDDSWHNVSQKAREYVLSGNAHKISHMCCKKLKKEPFHLYEKETNRKAILGVRGSESKMRASQYKTCFTKDGKFTPLHDLVDEVLDKIYKKYNIEIPKVYDYVSSTGCFGCCYGSYKHDTERELELLNENQFKFVCEYFKESYEVLGIDTKNVQLKLF